MAYLLEDDEENKKGNPNAFALGGSADDIGGGNPGGTTTGSPDSQRQFTDVHAYLDANRNQAAELGQMVAGRVSADADKLKGEATTAENDFTKQVNDNAIRPDANTVSAAFADPTNFVKDAGNVEKFTKQRDAVYGGPTDFATASGDVVNRVKTAAERAKTLDTSAGRKGYLAEITPNATAGMTSLDNLLIGGNADARAALGTAAGRFADVNKYLDEANNRTGAAVTQAKADADAARAGVQGKFGTAAQDFAKDVQTRFDAARSGAAARAQNIMSKVANPTAEWVNSLSPQDLADLDVSKDDLLDIVKKQTDAARTTELVKAAQNIPDTRRRLAGVPGLNFSDFMKENGASLDFGQFAQADDQYSLPEMDQWADPETYAKAAALRQLGYDPGILNGQAPPTSAELDALNFDGAGASKLAADRYKSTEDALVNAFKGWYQPSQYGNADQFRRYEAGEVNPFQDTEISELHKEAIRAAKRAGLINF